MNRPSQTTPPDSSSPNGELSWASSADASFRHAAEIARQCGLSPEILLGEPAPFQVGSDRSPAAEWARCGAMELSGYSDGPPEFAPGALATAARGAEIILRALAPAGAFADLDAPALLGERAAIAGLERRGQISCGGAARLLASRKGLIVAHLPRDPDWRSLAAWLESHEDPAWRAPVESNAEARWTRLAEAIAARDSARLIERGRLLGLAVAPAPTKIPRDAPLFRASQLSEKSPDARWKVAASGETQQRPLRLLDLSTLWAGPLAASLLAQCGVEVLKIESPDRPDGARLGPAAFFDLMHGKKAGCALDLKAAKDRSLFEALLEQADIVIESARPRAMEQLGYDASSWLSGSPGRIWASITGYGRADPGIAFGDDAGVAAGLAWPARESKAPAAPPSPSFCGDAIADPLTGLHTAALLLGWLRKGRGGLLDISLRDVTAHSARVTFDGLVAPLEEKNGKWHLSFPGESINVAPPRARPVTVQAPPLRAPTQRLIQHWTHSC